MGQASQDKPVLLVIEMDYHIDILGFFLACTDKSKFSVHCITTPHIAKKIPLENLKDVSLHQTTRNGEILRLLEQIKADCVFFNTCGSRYRFWAKNCPPNTIVRIHNINANFTPWQNITIGFNFLELRKAFTHILWKQIVNFDQYYLKKFLERVALYSFLSEANANYFVETRPDLVHKKGPVFPSAAYNASFVKETIEHTLKIVVPGTLEKKRKDFDAIRKLVNILSKSHHQVELYFAGKINSSFNYFVNELKRFETENFKIIFYHDFIPQNEFDIVLKQADILFFPIVINTRYKIFRELYGKSKISGSINDLIRFGKYAIMPSSYTIDENLRPLVYKYNSDGSDMQSVFENVYNSYKNNRDEYLSKLKFHAAQYSFENISAKQNEFLEKLILPDVKN